MPSIYRDFNPSKKNLKIMTEMVADLMAFSTATYVSNKDSKEPDLDTFSKELDKLEEKYKNKYNVSFKVFANDIANSPEGQKMIMEIAKEAFKGEPDEN